MKKGVYFVSWLEVEELGESRAFTFGNNTICSANTGAKLVTEIIKLITAKRPKATILSISRVE